MAKIKWCSCLGCGVEGRHPDFEEDNKISLFVVDKKGVDGVVCDQCESDDVMVDEVDESEF
jgi:hypothetical protein